MSSSESKRTAALAYLRRHPVICLLLLTPGIPEYLSSSSPLNAIVLNPVMFAFQLAANLALYGPGALLTREAMVRWNKGWPSVLLLGAAYGILEEGIALSTLFNSNAGPVGELGYYGHWQGVNWVWLAGIVPFHAVFSIAMPILLLGLALPETMVRPLLPGRKLFVALFVLGVDVLGLFLFVLLGERFWMGWPVFIGSFVAIGTLALLARRIGPGRLRLGTERTGAGPRRLAVVGAMFFPSILLSEYLIKGVGTPAFVDFVWVIALQGLFLAYILRVIGPAENERVKIAFTFGLILPIAAIGVIAEATLPLTLVADLVMVLFFRGLWRVYQTSTSQSSNTPSATT
jgi:hypothetical protein